MKRRQIGFFFFIALMLFNVSFAESEGEVKELPSGKIKIEHRFDQNGADNLSYQYKEHVKYKGGKYKLVKKRYEIIKKNDPVSVYVNVNLKDKAKLKKTITKTIDGVKYTLTAQSPKWKVIKENIKTYTRQYPSKNSVPERLNVSGSEFSLVGIKNETKIERYNTPLTFYAVNKRTNLYSFQGRLIKLKGNTPTWDGYERDIRRKLGENGSDYSISNVRWRGGFVKSGKNYVRVATVQGRKVIPMAVATFQNINPNQSYRARVKYVDEKYPQGKVSAMCICTYEKDNSFIKKLIAVGVGLLVISIAMASILYLMKRKKAEMEQRSNK